MKFSMFGSAFCLACSAVATADFTITPPLMHSAGARGNAGNSVYMYTYTGPGTIIDRSEFFGAISRIVVGTNAAEAHWNVRNTRFGTTGTVTFNPAYGIGWFEGSILIAATLGGGMILRTGDILRLETFESFDHAAGDDAIWTDVHWTPRHGAALGSHNLEIRRGAARNRGPDGGDGSHCLPAVARRRHHRVGCTL